jgi:dihydrofolate synthase/folylpolyglutamate synthase
MSMNSPRTLADWLAHCAAMHPKSMDLSLERTAEVARRLGIRFEVPLIVVGGTNGKGSTCAMLESIARHAGYRTGLYQKPELVHFEERCRIDGAPVKAEALVPHFEAVERARLGSEGPEGGAAKGDALTLTQFEFSTLAIARLLSLAPVDVVILEVGLGGRFDAVNVFDADCSIVTGVALDHMEWLGPDREAIGFEKAHIFRTGRPAIVGDPDPPRSLVDYAHSIDAELWLAGRDFHHAGDRQQWSWSATAARGGRRYAGMGYPALRGANQLLNASAALAALESLRGRLPVTAQAVRTGLALVELPGRFQIVPGQPTLVLDVAHNEQSVGALALNLDAMGFHPRTHAVFGVMQDKDIPALVARIAPLVDVWHLTALPTPRAATPEALAAVLAEVLPRAAPAHAAQVRVHTHPDPASALAAAVAGSDPVDRIVVFGSFLTVGGVLRAGLPRLEAPHLGTPRG